MHGTEGGVLIDAALTGEARYFGDGVEEKLAAIDNPLKNVVEDVVSCLENGTALRVSGREGRRTVALLEAIYRSSREGVPLAFESATGLRAGLSTSLSWGSRPPTAVPGWKPCRIWRR